MTLFAKWSRFSIPLLTGLVLLALFAGCINATYGRFRKDEQVNHAFRTGTVPTALNYYYAGRESMPYAILGIDPSYTVSSRFWITFAPQPEKLRSMSTTIYGNDRHEAYGFSILDPNGFPIGVWFSSLHFPSVKVDRENRTVEVRYKNPESYDDF